MRYLLQKNSFLLFGYLLVLSSFMSCNCQPKMIDAKSIPTSRSFELFDQTRERKIPVTLYEPAYEGLKKRLVIIHAGYGSSSTEYSYLGTALSKEGYHVVCVQHEIQGDKFLPSAQDGPVLETRLPFWEDGIKSQQVVFDYCFDSLPIKKEVHLIGHSNGGDIATLFTSRTPEHVLSCTTLDHRRVPVPDSIPFLTLRSSDYDADAGVLNDSLKQLIIIPTEIEHNYFRDNGSQSDKDWVIEQVIDFIDTKK